MVKSKFIKNIVFGFGGQIIIIILGIVVPRIMITSYGSDVNGLLSTISQIFQYIALLEAGIGQAARNALMKPLSHKNYKEISNIASVANAYYKRFAIYYGTCVVLSALVCPFIIKTDVNRITVLLVFLFEGMSGVVSFFYIQTITTMLSSDGRSYINNGINVVNKVLSYAVKIVMAAYGVNIILLQIVYFILTIAKVIFYKKYFTKHYSWINLKSVHKNFKLQDRNSYLLTEIAWTIFSSTDLIILSMFVSTKMSSVYGVYNLVFSSINLLLNAVYSSVSYTLGQAYHKNIKQYTLLHDVFTSVFLGGMTCLMCTTYIMIMPFINLYTQGISDVNYIQAGLPLMFSLIQIISWSRYITGNLSGIAGYAKVTSWISLIEALINIIISIILVQRFGICGVLFATVISLPLKVIFLTWLSEKKILNRNPIKYILILVANYIYFCIIIYVNRYIEFHIDNYVQFVFWGGIVFVCCFLISVCINIMVNPQIIQLWNKFKRRKKNE